MKKHIFIFSIVGLMAGYLLGGNDKAVSKTATTKTVNVFSVPEFLKDDVDFWAKVYREWDNNQVVFYDSPTKIVYATLNLPKINFELSSIKYKKNVEEKFKELTGALKRIDNGEMIDDRKLYDLIRKNGLISQKDLAGRLRYQNGLRSQFEYGLRTSGRYENDMKAVLKSQELPDELMAMPYVECLFYPSAISHAGASGLWGIVKETAVSFGIHVNNFTDERLDPVVATWAASRYLKKAKNGLSEWPLVITAYNYGYSGMLRAVSNLETRDLETVIKNHDSPLFGYASKNYYAEFLAALDTIRNHQHYFPGVIKDNSWRYEFVNIDTPVHTDDLIAYGAISRNDLMSLNPSLTKRTINGDEVIPAGYALRVLAGKAAHFKNQVKKIPKKSLNKASIKISSKYLAKGKETLAVIAKRFGISAEFLSKRMAKPLNHRPVGAVNIRSPDHLYTPIFKINQEVLSELANNPQAIPPTIGTP